MWGGGYLKALLLSSVYEYHGGMSDNDKMISDEAVEAAAKATFVHANLGSAWEDAQPDWQNAYRASVLAGLDAAAPYILKGDVEWTVFRVSDGENGSPAENLRYSTKAGAQESIDSRYGTPELWEPRWRVIGEWHK